MGLDYNKEQVLISMNKGDSGFIKITKIPTNKNFTVLFAVQNSKREFLIQLKEKSNYSDSVIFKIEKEKSELLEVPPNLLCQIYYWGVCLLDEEEDLKVTVRIGNKKFGEFYKFIVYPKKA